MATCGTEIDSKARNLKMMRSITNDKIQWVVPLVRPEARISVINSVKTSADAFEISSETIALTLLKLLLNFFDIVIARAQSLQYYL